MPDPTHASELDRLRYPIGRFQPHAELSDADRAAIIDEIAALPADLRTAVAGLTPERLDTPYRPDGWTVRQVVHHLPDSHLNGYVRFKWAMTEERPTIKAYDEAAWADLADARGGEIELSLALLEALHRRWVVFLRSLPAEAFDRTLRHPEIGEIELGRYLQLYAWHGRHHLAHIGGLRERMGW